VTDERIALKQLLDKSSDAEPLAEMIGYVANRLMQLEVETLCNAGLHERTSTRQNYRNGYRDRAWETRAGTLPSYFNRIIRIGGFKLAFCPRVALCHATYSRPKWLVINPSAVRYECLIS
jgi:hypothetical protein